MACTNPQNPKCPNCNKTGLAILPVRYAVVPSSVNATLPGAMGNKVSSVKLAHHKYALRTLRQGFVYLYHEKHPRGTQIKWEAYSVSEAGTLWKQLSINALSFTVQEPPCSRGGDNIPASVLTIEQPEKCGKVWIAFSEHAWSPETFKAFGGDAKLRDRRMQTFLPATWVVAGGYPHGLEATQANIEKVIEYQDGFNQASLTGGGQTGTFTAEDGTYKADKLQQRSTRYTLLMRKGQSKPVADVMKLIGKRSAGKPYEPIMIALWDAVGITHELNGFRNDAAGWVEKYTYERKFQIAGMGTLDGLKNALGQRAADQQDQFQKQMMQNAPQIGSTQERRANAATLPPAQRANELQVCDILDGWAQQKVPTTLGYSMRLNYANMESEPQRSADIAKVKADADQFLAERNKNAPKNIADARANAWPKYAAKLNQPAFDAFRKHYSAFLAAADKLIDERTDDLVAWLNSKSLVSALTEFHGQNIADGVVFDDQVGTAVYGMNSSIKGRAQINVWAKEMKATETNLMWRVVALNQDDAIVELNSALQEAGKYQSQRTLASTIDWASYSNKSLKAFADTYKKAVGVYNANLSAASAGGAKAFGVTLHPSPTFGLDKFGMSIGDSVFGHLRINGLADYACEKIIQHIFTIRAFVNPLDSVKLIVAQAKDEGLARQQIRDRLNIAKAFLAADSPAIKSAQSANLNHAWEEFKTNNPKGAANSIKDARLALVVMLIEGGNFSKLLYDCKTKGDAKSWWSLAASGMTITSAMFDIASVAAKVQFGGESWSYQNIKLAGGVLSAGATAVGAVFDFQEADKSRANGDATLEFAYTSKALLGTASFGLAAATTFTYAAPLIERIAGEAALGTAARVIGARAAAIIGTRILFMSAGSWITVISFGIQCFIWIYTDDALQTWCSLCVFGKKHATAEKAYKKLEDQNKELEKALVKIGVGG
jgi:hypothetical protein